MSRYDGPGRLLMPDGDVLVTRIAAGQRGEQWAGSVALSDTDRRLEQGDVCRLFAEPIGELRVIITEWRGARHYAFVSLITPDPRARLD